MRKKYELRNVLRALRRQKIRLLEYGWNRKNYWEIIDTEYYYVEFVLMNGYLPELKHSDDDVRSCYNWLSCQGSEDYYEDVLIELSYGNSLFSSVKLFFFNRVLGL